MRVGIAGGGLVVVVVLAAIGVPASSALARIPHKPVAVGGGIGIGLISAAADSANRPLARSYIMGQLAPGTRVRRQVEIVNDTRSPANVAIYPAAASVSKGQFEFAPGRTRNELSSWTRISQPLLRLPPGAKAIDTLTINVPKQTSSGERYAVIWAQVSTPRLAGGVTLVNRVGIRIYLSIGLAGGPSASFTIDSLTATRSATGQPLVVARIHNNGQRTLGISGSLTLSNGPGGLSAGPFPVHLERAALTPHSTEPASVELNKVLPRGPWQAHLLLSSGFILRTAVARFSFP